MEVTPLPGNRVTTTHDPTKNRTATPIETFQPAPGRERPGFVARFEHR